MSVSESGLQVAPAPWLLKARTWQFIVPTPPKNASFPAGWAAPWQADALATGGEFIGGPSMVMLIQYTESPVGPYDELGYIPGRWKFADGSVGFRTTSMYVSSKDSTENGRRNWNIPKQVASFKYTKLPNGSWSLSVSEVGSESTPFFCVTINTIPILSKIHIPYNSSILGDLFSFTQPPLPQGPLPEEVGTDKWAAVVSKIKGSMYLGTVVPELEKKGEKGGKKVIGDGIAFPALVPWKIAMCLEGVEVDLVAATWRDSV